MKNTIRFEDNLSSIPAALSFASPTNAADEFEELRRMILGTSGAQVGIDRNGTPHAVSSLNAANMSTVDHKRFASPANAADEFEELRQMILGNSNGQVAIDRDGVAHVVSSIETGNMSTVDEERFAGDGAADVPFHRPEVAANAMDGLNLTADGLIDTNHAREPVVSSLQSSNLSAVSDERFAAVWYESNTQLINSITNEPLVDANGKALTGKRIFEAEKASMLERFPKARLGKLESTGEIYWELEADILGETWHFLLIYDNDHPHADNWGGSCRAIPIIPSIDEIRQRARDAGRGYVPHIVKEAGQSVEHLCTISKSAQREYLRKGLVEPACQVAARSIWWATQYTIGLKDPDVWNEFSQG